MSSTIMPPPTRAETAALPRIGVSRRVVDRVFGFDFFISYAWADGALYAHRLNDELRARGYEVFLDRNNYGIGDDWKGVGAWTLRRTSRLILVGTPLAILSEPVLRELTVFSKTDRRIIPIDFEGSLATLPDDSPVTRFLPPSVLRIQESRDRLSEGPSADALAALTRTFDITRQQQKRVRVIKAAAVVFAGLAVAATVFGVRAETQRRLAVGRYLASAVRIIASVPETDARDRDLLAALVVEALRRLPERDARSLAAGVAPRLGQQFPVGGHSSKVPGVEFVPERNELAWTGLGLGLGLIDLESGSIRAIPAQELGAHDGGPPLSSFGRASPDGRHIVIESFPNYLVDTRSLDVKVLHARQWSGVFASDGGRIAYTDIGGDGHRLGVLNLGDSDRVGHDPRIYDLITEASSIEVAYADGPYVLFDNLGHVTRVDDGGTIRIFEVPRSLKIASLVSNGTSALLVAQGNRVIKPPAPLYFDDDLESSSAAPPSPVAGSKLPPTPSIIRPILQVPAAPGLYRLDLETGRMDMIPSIEKPVSLGLEASTNTLFVLCENGVAIVDTVTGTTRFHPGKSTVKDISGGIRDTALVFNEAFVVAKDGVGWLSVDRRTGTDWFVPQQKPNTALLAGTSAIAVFIGDYDWLIADLTNRSILAQFSGSADPEQIAINASGAFMALARAGQIRLVRLDPAQLAQALCQQPGHNLTPDQSALYLPDERPHLTCDGWLPG
jgi:hypothetical protein